MNEKERILRYTRDIFDVIKFKEPTINNIELFAIKNSMQSQIVSALMDVSDTLKQEIEWEQQQEQSSEIKIKVGKHYKVIKELVTVFDVKLQPGVIFRIDKIQDAWIKVLLMMPHDYEQNTYSVELSELLDCVEEIKHEG